MVYKLGLHTLSKLLKIFAVSIRKFLDSTPLEAAFACKDIPAPESWESNSDGKLCLCSFLYSNNLPDGNSTILTLKQLKIVFKF